ncbi:unnamed protein product [Amaranthus hypochondriacus]
MAIPEAMEFGHNSVAIGIEKGKSSQQAVQWTIDQFLKGAKDLSVILVHVKTHNHHNAQMSNGGSNGFAPSESEVKQLFLPYRGYCGRKGVTAYEVVIHDIDVSSALISFIDKNNIGNIVVGASNHNAITRRFKQQDVPTSLEKSAPEFCSVYVIYKGKVQSMRASNVCQVPARTSFSSRSSSRSHSSMGSGFDSKSSGSSHSDRSSQSSLGAGITPYNNLGGYDNAPRKAQAVHPHSNNNYENPSRKQSMGHASIPHGTSYDNSSRYQGSMGPPSHQHNTSSFDNNPRNYNREGINKPSEYNEHRPRTTTNSQSYASEELDTEMRQLKLEIKKTMDLYKSVCDQATLAKQKADHLQGREGENIDTIRLAREAAMIVAELERKKCKAAMDAAQMTEKLVELETQKRKLAEERAARRDGDDQRSIGNHVSHRVYNFKEIEVATNNFSKSLKIGEGGYGPVYRAMLQHTPVAIKVLKSDATQGLKQFQQEIEVLGRIRHPNMVLLLGACPQYGCLVYEYMENGSLEDRLFRKNNTPPIPWRTRFKIAAEMASALLFLHEAKPEPLVHRDLKPANILLDANYTSKIADVGLARLVPPAVANQVTQYHMTAAAGTFCYIDPEYQQTGKLGTKSDVYSLGIMLLQLLTAKSPMALAYHVEEAIDEGTFSDLLDPSITDWPVAEALSMAKLALRCSELRKKDRPDLDSIILPELVRLRDFSVNCS